MVAMAVLKLMGVVSTISGGHMIIGGHEPSCIKVNNLGLCTPSNKFHVTMPRSLDTLEVINFNGAVMAFDSSKIIGKKVIVWVRPRRYSFRSKYQHNKNEVISGTSLVMFKLQIVNSI
jgi:hypothetical protein